MKIHKINKIIFIIFSPLYIRKQKTVEFQTQHKILLGNFHLNKQMPYTQKDVFSLTKTLYDQMYQYYQANQIAQEDQIEQFILKNIQPLYPSKPVQNLENLRGSDIVTKRQTYNEHGRKEIRDRKASLGQYTEFQFDFVSEQQQSDKGKVIYSNVIRRYKMKELCLKLGTGNFFCCSTSPPDKVYQDMGLSTCLYLKFVKHLIYTLLIISPFSILMMIMFYLTAIDNEISPQTNYRKFLFSFSIGTLSLQGINCRNFEVSNIDFNKNVNLELNCAVGFVNIIGPTYTKGSFESLQNCRKDIDNFLMYQQSDTYLSPASYTYQTDCHSQSQSCTYTIRPLTKNQNFPRISVTYECIKSYLDLGAIQIKRNGLLYLTVIFDLFGIMILIIFLWSQMVAQNKEEKYFKDKQFLLNSFALQVGPFDIGNLQQQIDQFLQYIEGKNNDRYAISLKRIVQIRLPDDPEFNKHQKKRKIAYQKLYKLIGKQFIQNNFNPYLYVNQKDFVDNHFQNQTKYKKYVNQLQNLIKQYKHSQQLKKKHFSGAIDIYIIFEKPKYRRIIFENSKMGTIRTKKKQYELKQVVPPQLLLWENIYKSKLPRIILSVIITILTMIGSYILLAFIWSLRKKTMTNYNFDVDCTVVYAEGELNNFDPVRQQTDQTSTYVHCYCLQDSFFSINTSKLCEQWSARYFEYLIIPLMFSLTAIGLNILLSLVYKKLSEFEAYHKLTSQLYSYIVKKTFLLILLLSMVIIWLSFRQQFYQDLDPNSPFQFLYSGLYKDISPDWYQQIGVIIIITLAFNIITPLIQVLLYFLKQLYIKVRILIFKRSPNYCQLKKTFIQFYKIDIFPIQQRYAQLLAITTMCLSLSCVFPIMILVLVIQLGLFAIIDKILIIKAYHKPINFQEKLHRKVIYTFFAIILIHLVITVILLSQKYLLASGRANDDSIFSIDDSRISAIFDTSYIVPYVIMFFIIIIGLLSIIFSRLFYITKPNKSLKIGQDGLPFQQHKFYNLLNSEQLNKTILLKEKQWKRLKIYGQKYFYPQHKKNKGSTINRNSNKNPSSTENEEQDLHSAQRMLIIPESNTLLQQSSKYLQVSCIEKQNNDQSQNPTFKQPSSSTTSSNKLKSIIKYSYYRLLSKKQKNQHDKLRLTRLMGMSAYEHYDDWLFMEEFVQGDYKITGL